MKSAAALALFWLAPVMAIGEAPGSDAIWNEFAARLRAGSLTNEDLRPYYPRFRAAMLESLAVFRKNSRPEDWNARAASCWRPASRDHPADERRWQEGPVLLHAARRRFEVVLPHVESIFIRLDQLGPLLASRFPDVTEAQKAWMRDERRVTEQIKVYNLLAREKGREFALRLFRDGAAYALEARTWVPFVPPSKALILFLCWEQANLLGNPVTLVSMDEAAASVVLQPRWFRLYKQTGHLRPTDRGGRVSHHFRDDVAGPGSCGRLAAHDRAARE